MVLLITLLISTFLYINASPVMTRERLVIQKICEETLKFNHYYYLLEERKNITGVPADMTVHWKTGKIFFTLITETMRMSLHVLLPSGEIDDVKVDGIGQSTAVDNLNDIVYLATDNGVYKYKDDATTELYTAAGEDVMYVAVSSDGGIIYIATWPQNRVSKITNDGQKVETFSLIPNGHGLTIDTRDNIYFTASKTSYMLKNGQSIPIKINGLPSDKMSGVFVSRSDEVFAMDENSNFYLIDPDNASANLLGNFKVAGVNAFAIDGSDNILIGVKDGIVIFSATEMNPCDAKPNEQPIKGMKTLFSPVLPPRPKTVEQKPVVPTMPKKSVKPRKNQGKTRKSKKTTTTTTTEAIDDEEE